MSQLQQYRNCLNVITLVMLMSAFLCNSIFYYGLLLNGDLDLTEIVDFGEENEKEEEKKEEISDDKIRVLNDNSQSLSCILLAKAQHLLNIKTLHHPEIVTPPPEVIS